VEAPKFQEPRGARVSYVILVVDDERGVNDLVCDAVRLAGHEAVAAFDGAEALRMLREHDVDLVILDVNMPRIDGFQVLTAIRNAEDSRPVILLTARQARDDVRMGFELGADDFVRKPFGIEELTLRVSAVLRRTQPESGDTVLQVGPVRLDSRSHRVTCADADVELSHTEFRLLQMLMEHVNEVLTKDLLLRRIWGLDGTAETTVVETYISYLRRKLGDNVVIRTVRGVGYQLVDDRTGA
jgi:two-component system OmpR family response regulator